MKEFVLDDYNRKGGYLLFFETSIKNEIIYMDTYDLQTNFRLHPKFRGIDIESYFKDIMMSKIILSCEDLGDCFTLSSIIIDEYKKNGIDEFLKMYATYIEKYEQYTIDPTFSYDEKLSIAYCFYLNNIYTKIDCYSGYFNSQKFPLVLVMDDEDNILDLLELEIRK